MAGGSHGCGATDYCIVGRGGPAPGTGRDFAIAHRAGEPSGASPHYFGVPRRAFGLCRGAGDAGEPADSDAVLGACCRTRSVGGAGRSRAPWPGCEDYGGGANLAQGTVCKILAAHEVKPHKVRYYLERRDPEFEPKMAEVLCVYRKVAMR